jgi:hypothetical protein
LTCDDANDAVGCIFTENKLTPLASKDDIAKAVAGVKAGGAAAAAAAPAAEAAAPAAAAAAAPAAEAAAAAPAAAAGQNVQTFTGALGGAAPPVIFTAGSDRPFAVDGSTFLNKGAALQRSCSVQHNACANAANSGKISGGSAQCETQQSACEAAAKTKKRRSTKERRAALNFGTCGSPAIEFAAGLDGRKENSFKAVNTKDFNHGSALNIKVVADFNCDRLNSNCKAPAATVDKCRAASTAAQALGKTADAATAFNKALGVSA